MSTEQPDYTVKYTKWIEKRLSGKPAPMQKFLRRSYHSGLMVLSALDGIPFEKLSSSLYFLSQDMQAEQLSRKYEALLELAGASPDRFMANIHKELNGISRYVKENDLLPEFCEFISACDRLRCIRATSDIDVWQIMTAYMELLLQTCSYFHPSRFDFRKRFCGCSTKGEVLLCNEYYPYADDVGEALTKNGLGGKTLDSRIAFFASQYGYPEITSYTELQFIMMRDVYHTAQIASMVTYVNEYTYDMLPDTEHLFSQNVKALESLRIKTDLPDVISGRLMKRARTLPSNGLYIEFSYVDTFPSKDQLKTLLMKEVLHDDRIILLYKLRMSDQDLSGYYDTKDDFFHSLFLEVENSEEVLTFHEKLQSVILYLYAAATTRDNNRMFTSFESTFSASENSVNALAYPIFVSPYFRGGKLRNTYLESDRPYNPTGSRVGNDKYERTERSIQGYIRRVGAGRSPSKEAVARAEALGFSLEPDETYVQPFTRHVLRLRRK